MDFKIETTKIEESLYDSGEKDYFSSSQWLETLVNTYGFKVIDSAYSIKNQIKAFMPLINIKILNKDFLANNVFNFYTDIYFFENYEKEYLKFLEDIANKKNTYLRIFTYKNLEKYLPEKNIIINNNVRSVLFLEKDYLKNFNKYKKQFRTNIKSLKKIYCREKIEIKETEDINFIERFYNMLYKMYKKKHNILCQPKNLFKNLFLINNRDNIRTTIKYAQKGDETIGCIFLIYYKDKIFYAYSATNLGYYKYSPGSVLLDHTVQYGCENNYKIMDFGLSSIYDKNLRFYKSRFGTIEQPLYKYYIGNIERVEDTDTYKSFEFAKKIVKIAPDILIYYLNQTISKYFA